MLPTEGMPSWVAEDKTQRRNECAYSGLDCMTEHASRIYTVNKLLEKYIEIGRKLFQLLDINEWISVVIGSEIQKSKAILVKNREGVCFQWGTNIVYI
jgi:hypothetical protein